MSITCEGKALTSQELDTLVWLVLGILNHLSLLWIVFLVEVLLFVLGPEDDGCPVASDHHSLALRAFIVYCLPVPDNCVSSHDGDLLGKPASESQAPALDNIHSLRYLIIRPPLELN